MNSRNKGKRGEREAAKVVAAVFGVEARRGQQFQGSPDSPDVIGIPGVHIEVKYTDALRLYAALEQAVEDAGDSVPVVMHRRTRGEWLWVVRVVDVPRLVGALRLLVGGEG